MRDPDVRAGRSTKLAPSLQNDKTECPPLRRRRRQLGGAASSSGRRGSRRAPELPPTAAVRRRPRPSPGRWVREIRSVDRRSCASSASAPSSCRPICPVCSRPSMKICRPLRQYCSTTFASVPNSPRLKTSHIDETSGSFSHCPVCWFFFRLPTAKPNFATLPPLGKRRTSGSRVSRPINITLFKLCHGTLQDGTDPVFALPQRGQPVDRRSILPLHNQQPCRQLQVS